MTACLVELQMDRFLSPQALGDYCKPCKGQWALGRFRAKRVEKREQGYGAAEKNTVSLAFCWSHVRRRFYELVASGRVLIAGEALKRIAKLYHIEDEIRGKTQDERRAVRQ
jgi:hypothetical protein